MQQAYNTPVIRSIPTTTSLRPIYLPDHPEVNPVIRADIFQKVFGGTLDNTNYRHLSYLNPLPAKVTGGRKPRKSRRK